MTDKDTLSKLSQDIRDDARRFDGCDDPQMLEFADRLDAIGKQIVEQTEIVRFHGNALAAQQVPELKVSESTERVWRAIYERIVYAGESAASVMADYDIAQQVPEAGEFEVWQDDMMVAGSSGPWHDALRDAQHYATQYAQDGDVCIFEVRRTLVAALELSGAAGSGEGK